MRAGRRFAARRNVCTLIPGCEVSNRRTSPGSHSKPIDVYQTTTPSRWAAARSAAETARLRRVHARTRSATVRIASLLSRDRRTSSTRRRPFPAARAAHKRKVCSAAGVCRGGNEKGSQTGGGRRMNHTRSSFLAVLAAGLPLYRPLVARAQTSGPLRIGSTPNDSYAEPFYAQDMGFFQRAGLNVAVEAFPNGAGVTTALAGNAIDVGITNPISLANAVEHGLPFQFFAVAAMYNREELALCVAAESPIKSARDLNGKTIATTAVKDSNSLHIVAWIDRNGGDSATIQLVEMPFSAMAAAVRRGTVAAAPIAEPALSAAKKAGGLRVLGHPMDVYGKRFMVGGWFGRADFLSANAASIRRLTAAIYATADWANRHPDESAAIRAKYAKLDPAVVKTMNRAPYGTSLAPEMLQPYLDLGYKYRYLERRFSATELIAKV